MIRDLVVELVSPAMIGGADKGTLDDPPYLRPPSLRGQLGFWSRALGGDALAEELWGNTESGQRVRLLLSRSFSSGGSLKQPVEATVLEATDEHGEFRTEMIPPGDRLLLRFSLPDAALLPKLQAVVWTFLHLGAVGKRSRRGYGSLRWLPAKDDLLADWPRFWPSHHLTSPEKLADYLKEGLAKVRAVLGVPGDGPRSAGAGERLVSIDQVFVGMELPGEWEVAGGGGGEGPRLEHLLHGLNAGGRGGEPECSQLGRGKPRVPSPMLWRVFPVHGRRAVLPVMTWFPRGYQPASTPRLKPDSGVYRYLYEQLGFTASLTGGALAEEPAEDGEAE